eukprot:749946-Hanusia_phi.AAC.2
MPGAMAVKPESDEVAMMKMMKKQEKKTLGQEKRKRGEKVEKEEKEEKEEREREREGESKKKSKKSKKSKEEAQEQDQKEDHSDDESKEEKTSKKKNKKKKADKDGGSESEDKDEKDEVADRKPAKEAKLNSRTDKPSKEEEKESDQKEKSKKKDGRDTKARQDEEGKDEESFRASLHISLSGGGENKAPPCVRTLEASPFSKSILKAMKIAGFTSPSPIQSQAWPIASAGYDMVAVAKTGSGKTLGFLLPAFTYLDKLGGGGGGGGGGGCKVLVLAPTRELAIQIESECNKFGKEAGVACCCLYGGVPLGPQKAALKKGPAIVIATPGRLVDLMSQDCCELGQCTYVVLDEADRMLDMGFEPQIKTIFDALPGVEGRQTLFFTATWWEEEERRKRRRMRRR